MRWAGRRGGGQAGVGGADQKSTMHAVKRLKGRVMFVKYVLKPDIGTRRNTASDGLSSLVSPLPSRTYEPHERAGVDAQGAVKPYVTCRKLAERSKDRGEILFLIAALAPSRGPEISACSAPVHPCGLEIVATALPYY